VDLILDNVKKNYRLGKVEIPALRGISMKIIKGDFLCIAGPSGSGKSTLLNVIGCLDLPTIGEILFDGVNIQDIDESEREKIRRNTIGFIFQSFNLIETLNVRENIEYPALGGKYGRKELTERADFLLAELEIIDLKKRFPNELSGGQRQRAAIARAFINNPEVILADEPTANLDSETGMRVINLMKKINEENNTTLVFSTHDPRIMEIATKIVKLEDGKIKGEM